jgi:hypothetical protein
MKHYTLCLGLVATLFWSCKTGNEFPADVVDVRLCPSLTQLTEGSNTPMNVKNNTNRSSGIITKVIYAVQIFENNVKYYYGLFDNPDSMKIALSTNKSYNFRIAAFKIGTGSGLRQDETADGQYFYLPNKVLLGNKFIKGSSLKDINLISSIKLRKLLAKDYPEIDVFYCDKTINAEKGITNIDFNMLRMGFGVTFNVDGLTYGKLNIYMGDDTISIVAPTTTYSTIRLFKPLKGDLATIFNKADSYSEPIDIEVQWIGNGTVSALESTFSFNRNYCKTINIQINTVKSSLQFEEWLTAWYKPVNHNLNLPFVGKTWTMADTPFQNITDKRLASHKYPAKRLI